MVEKSEKVDSAEKLEIEAVNVDQSKLFTLEILNVVKEAQQQHGLRHGDYQRYRGYCSRRVRRLRKALKFPQSDKRHFKKRDVTVAQVSGKRADERFIHIPLMYAERSWSYAMQLKQESNSEPRKRFKQISKLRKACVYSLQLQNLCNTDYFDARTKLECEAYMSWMHGSLHFELQLWKSAGEHLKRAQVIYENLSKALSEDEQELYRSKVNEFAPNLRYCAYNISGGGGGGNTNIDDLLELRAQGLMEDLDVLVNQAKSERNEGLQTVDWRERKITVRSEKVRLFLLSIQDLDKTLEKTSKVNARIELLERTLMDCKDAINAVKDEIKQDPKLRSTTTGQTVSSVQLLLAYLNFIRHSRTLQRNLCLVEENKSHYADPNQSNAVTISEGKRVRSQDLVRLYEIILQNITELQQISGMQDDSAYQEEIKNQAVAFKAFRCYYIALTLIDMKKWKEAVALYERSLKYASEALRTKPNEAFVKNQELTALISIIESCKYSAHAYSVLEATTNSNSSTPTLSKNTKSALPLYKRLSQYKEDPALTSKQPNVFKLTPQMEPIPCKPLFFDLALNYVEMPQLDDKLDSPSANAPTISGFVKGFLGWGGKK